MNYRPVSLTCVSYKILEHVICRHVLDHLERHQILTNVQHGFRSGHSCETQLINTLQDIQKHYDQKHQVDITVLDFSNAFDTVPHQRLISKLNHYGIRGEIRSWISTFLSNRQQRVVVEGEVSDDTSVDSGVPQRTILGPFLFLLHINDLPTVVNSTVRLFADDCLLYRPIITPEDQHLLQQDLVTLEHWSTKWGMRFNAKKCEILRITRSRSPLQHMYTLCDDTLSQVKDTRYLGLTICVDLRWTKHIEQITGKANSSLGFLRSNAQSSNRRPTLHLSGPPWNTAVQRGTPTWLRMLQS